MTEGLIGAIRDCFRRLDYEYSRHALDQSLIRGIFDEEVQTAIQNGEVIEDYPADKYGPSCLVLGHSLDRRPLHIHCTYPDRRPVKVITLYEPDPQQWIDFRRRRVQ